MYVIDFFQNMIKKHRIPVLIYLVLNIFIITAIVYYCLLEFFAVNIQDTSGSKLWLLAFLIAMILYAISTAIALSPVGEWMLRIQNGCYKIKRQDFINRLMPLYKEVYEKALSENPTLSKNVKLYMNDSDSCGAYAIGRNAICITRGMMTTSDEEIKSVIAHEFGHIVNKDTDLILIITVGNMIITGIILFIRVILTIICLVLAIATIFNRGRSGGPFWTMVIVDAVIAALMWIWTKIGQLLVMKTSRSQEYLADEYAYRLGYANGLCFFLDNRLYSGKDKGVFAVLASSHPRRDDRIARLQKLGATYSA
ncbi:MAG: M48 family metalloprotease [Lachnospiraceae bacterium]|nr:M48 family metalloprotease [Lachnospiraceae bacterium]